MTLSVAGRYSGCEAVSGSNRLYLLLAFAKLALFKRLLTALTARLRRVSAFHAAPTMKVYHYSLIT